MGETFLTFFTKDEITPLRIQHEAEHRHQWRIFGVAFAGLYGLEGTNPCTNYFEQKAGLIAGGYGKRCGRI